MLSRGGWRSLKQSCFKLAFAKGSAPERPMGMGFCQLPRVLDDAYPSVAGTTEDDRRWGIPDIRPSSRGPKGKSIATGVGATAAQIPRLESRLRRMATVRGPRQVKEGGPASISPSERNGIRPRVRVRSHPRKTDSLHCIQPHPKPGGVDRDSGSMVSGCTKSPHAGEGEPMIWPGMRPLRLPPHYRGGDPRGSAMGISSRRCSPRAWG